MIKKLKAIGWKLDRVNGSHHIMVKGKNTVSVPVHGKTDIPKGTLHNIMKEGGLK